MLAQSVVCARAGFLQLLNLGVDLIQRFPDRKHHLANGLLPLVQVTLGRFLEGLQGGLGQFDEGLVIALKGFGRECLEGVE